MFPEPFLLAFFVGMISTILFVRVYLLASPHTNVYVLGHNVHHLYTGALFLILLTILNGVGFTGKIFYFFEGVASGLIIDQLVYLIISRGGHRAYFTRVSFLGAFVVSSVLLFFALLVSYFFPL